MFVTGDYLNAEQQGPGYASDSVSKGWLREQLRMYLAWFPSEIVKEESAKDYSTLQ